LKADGTVVAWGNNDYGQTDVPSGLSGVTAIAAGAFHNLALEADGTVVAWGWNYFGQSSVPDGLSDVTAISAGGFHSLALKADGTVVAWGNNDYGQTDVPSGLSNVTAIAAGYRHSLALKSDGTVVAWGDNLYGQTNVPSELSNVTAIAAGFIHSLALKSDGTVVAWGDNQDGAVSIPAGLSGVIAIAAGFYHNLVLKGDGTVVAWGDNSEGQTNVPSGLSGVTAIAASGEHNLALVPAAPDTTAPIITPNVAGTLGSNGWYTSDVTVSWSVVDAESTISSQTGCDTTTVTSDTNGVTFTCTATSAGGTNSQPVTIKRDATAPTIAFASRTPANSNSWNNSAVSVIWTCSDAMSGANAANVSQTLTSEGANQSATGTCMDLAGNSASDTQSGINIDTTAPSGVSGTPTTSPNATGWYNAPVTVMFSGTDTTSGIAGCTSASYTGPDSSSASLSGSCTDQAGNTSATVASSSFKYDATAPTLAPSVSPNPVLLNGSASASPNANDGLSSVASASCGAPTTSSIGAKSVSCSATDQAGNTASANANYTVIYNFSGFFSPVANAPTLNQVSGGSSVALTFGLAGNQGLNILATNFPASRPIDCKTLAPLGTGSYQAANPSGKSGLTYNATTNQYTYSWKTDKMWAGNCRQFDLKLIDGTEHLVNFKFK
ncbi:MAG: PxKF domain-containing protein, partial [Roseiflexaceae bacterium]